MTEENRGPELEMSSAGLHGNGSSSGTYYKVEYRNTTAMVHGIGSLSESFPFVIDNYWRTLPIQFGNQQWGVNIPIKKWDADPCKNCGLLSMVAAEAHRWAFLAALDTGVAGPGGALCVETRLVAVEYSSNYSTKEVGVTPHGVLRWKPDTLSPRASKDTPPPLPPAPHKK